MTLRRRRALAEPAARAAAQLRRAEATIALLDRVRPRNLLEERARLLAAWQRGERPHYAPAYAPPGQLGDVRRALSELSTGLAAAGVEARLLAERALELELEAELCEQIGTPSFRALAVRRFAPLSGALVLQQTARQWLSEPLSVRSDGEQLLHLSDDLRDPDSLLSLVSARVSQERLAIRIEVDAQLASLAAVADGVLRVRGGARLSASVARRIALHEVEGHLLPRQAGHVLGGAFAAGTARASEDEEGRAILLEERAGLFGSERRHELCRRYLAAASAHEGAELWDTVELLRGTGAEVAAAIELACRVHRGGGMGRELVYLAGYLRVSSTLKAEPELERVLRSGRVSLSAAKQLASELEPAA